ncbi:MAG: HEPN domain-containing protein [Smithellaceae bacterium]|nr:HEPN domain-containing protein [Smithellaceae bacterium]
MVDISKQIQYWKDAAVEDWDVAKQLLDIGKTRYALFFVHLTLEKALKSLVCQKTNDLAPRMHNLNRLAEIAGLDISDHHTDVLSELMAFHIEGRYPDSLSEAPSKKEAMEYFNRGQEVLQWLMKQ